MPEGGRARGWEGPTDARVSALPRARAHASDPRPRARRRARAPAAMPPLARRASPRAPRAKPRGGFVRHPSRPPRLARLGKSLGASLVLLLLHCSSAARAQMGAPGVSLECPVDIDAVRLDASLGASCDPDLGDALCDRCLCDFSERLVEAGYRVTGPDAVPFQACALANVVPLQRAGLTVSGMMAVAARCTEEPACIAEIEAKHERASAEAPPPAPEETRTAVSRTPEGEVPGGLERARAASSDGPASASSDDRDRRGSVSTNAARWVGAAAAVSFAAAAPTAYHLRDRRRRRLAAKRDASPAASSVATLAFEGITCETTARCVRVAITDSTRRDEERPGASGSPARGSSDGSLTAVVARAAEAPPPPPPPPPRPGRRRERVSRRAATFSFFAAKKQTVRFRLAPRTLLRDVSGSFSRGETVAVLGPSGAGKSTLLRAISGRADASTGVRVASGRATLDGARVAPEILRETVAFVPQSDDHLSPFLTVRETVAHAAALKLPWYASAEEKRERVAGVLEDLSLTTVADSLVGRPGDADARGSSLAAFSFVSSPFLAVSLSSPFAGGCSVCPPFSGVRRCPASRASATKGGARGRGDRGGASPGGDGGGGEGDDASAPGRRFGVPKTNCVGGASDDDFAPGQSESSSSWGAPRASGVSGGERRRVACAAELVADPTAIVLDEPTSGLDAAAASSMTATLRRLARRGKIVVFSVHQPSPRVFRAMDRVVLLGPRGAGVLWRGAPGDAEAAFEAMGVGVPSEEPAGLGALGGGFRLDISEWMVEAATRPDARAKLLAAAAREETIASSSLEGRDGSSSQSSLGAAADDEDVGKGDGAGGGGIVEGAVATASGFEKKAREKSFWTDLLVLLSRHAKTTARDPSLFLAHVSVASLTALILGALYLRSPHDLAGFQNRAGGFFFTLVFFGLAGVSAADGYSADAATRTRDVRSGVHGAGAYVAAYLAVDIAALRVPPAACYTAILYHMMGLREGSGKFFTFLGVLTLFASACAAACALVATASPSRAVATLVSTFLLLLSAMFGGFLVSIESVPAAMRWLRWLSPYQYAWGAMLASEMEGEKYLFDTDLEGVAVEIEVTGRTYLDTFGVHPRTLGRDAGALGAIVVGLAALTCVAVGAAARPRA